jgi:predicted nucleic acid-binding protein
MRVFDTNIVSAYLKPGAETSCPKVVSFVQAIQAGEGLSIAFVTQFELRRGVELLVRRGQGRRKRVELEMFLDQVEVLGLDAPGGGGWNVAARLWAEGRDLKPAHLFSDGDLLIAATAAFHGRPFVTADANLAEGLRRLSFPVGVELVPIA